MLNHYFSWKILSTLNRGLSLWGALPYFNDFQGATSEVIATVFHYFKVQSISLQPLLFLLTALRQGQITHSKWYNNFFVICSGATCYWDTNSFLYHQCAYPLWFIHILVINPHLISYRFLIISVSSIPYVISDFSTTSIFLNTSYFNITRHKILLGGTYLCLTIVSTPL